MRHLAMTGMETAAMISRIFLGLAMRATPPSARICAGTRSRAITETAPAFSAMTACSALVTSMMTPPLSISARPVLRRREVVLLPLFWDMSGTLLIPFAIAKDGPGARPAALDLFYSPFPIRGTGAEGSPTHDQTHSCLTQTLRLRSAPQRAGPNHATRAATTI